MNYRNAIVVLILLVAVAWWFLHEDPEAEVRAAHQELTRLLSKAEGEASTSTLLDARNLQSLFADNCVVTGDAEMFAGSYTSEEMVGTIIRVKGALLRVDLTFHDLEIEFPAADDAIGTFTAVLVGKSMIDGEAEAAEAREVVSRMRKVEGKWRFAEFNLSYVIENEGAEQ